VQQERDFTLKTANGGIGISQQLIAERQILAERFLQFSHFDIGVVQLCDKAHACGAVDRRPFRLDQLRAAEEIALN
jgi:hypothetical protein